jgi:hypothetical protein
MINWVERARRRLGLEETDPDYLPPFGEDEAESLIQKRGTPQKSADKTSQTPSSSLIDHDDSSSGELTKLTKPTSSGLIDHGDDVDESCEPEKTPHSENRTDKTDETSEAVESPSSDELTKLTKPPLGDHSSIFEAAARARPPDVKTADWEAAIRGLSTFLRAGRGAEAERLGWPPDELYRAPELWSQIQLTGSALLIGDREVADITADKIQIKTASGATLSFYRRPQPDYGLVYRERLKVLRGLGADEAHFRSSISPSAFAANIPASTLSKRRRRCGTRSPRPLNDQQRSRADLK